MQTQHVVKNKKKKLNTLAISSTLIIVTVLEYCFIAKINFIGITAMKSLTTQIILKEKYARYFTLDFK